MSSASAISDAIVTNLSATSALGVAVSNKTYMVLEQSSTCAAVVEFSTLGSRAMAMEGQRYEWTFRVTLYIKDTGNPQRALADVMGGTDKIVSSLWSDRTLQGTCKQLQQINGLKNKGEAVEAGGTLWIPVEFMVVATDWDN